MDVRLTARHLPVTEELRAFAEERATRLEHYFDRAHDVEIILSRDGDEYTAEIVAGATRGHTVAGHAKERELHVAIDRAMEKIERQMTKMKEQVRSRRGRGGSERMEEDRRRHDEHSAEPSGEMYRANEF